MMIAPLSFTNVLKFHNTAIALMLIASYSLGLTLLTTQFMPELKTVTLPITLAGFFFGVIFFMIEYEIEAKNHAKIILWAKQSYNVTLEQNQALELYRFSLTEYVEGKSVIQLCLIEKDKKFFLYSTTEIKILKGN